MMTFAFKNVIPTPTTPTTGSSYSVSTDRIDNSWKPARGILASTPNLALKGFGFQADAGSRIFGIGALGKQEGSYANPIGSTNASNETFISILRSTKLSNGQTAFAHLGKQTQDNVNKMMDGGSVTYQSLINRSNEIFPVQTVHQKLGKQSPSQESNLAITQKDTYYPIELPNEDGTTQIVVLNESAAKALQAHLMSPAIEAMLARHDNKGQAPLKVEPKKLDRDKILDNLQAKLRETANKVKGERTLGTWIYLNRESSEK